MDITPDTYRALGLDDKEYEKIKEILGRDPTSTELAMFSVEWSEHCGYMCSRPLLGKLPKKGKFDVTVGEDSGAIIVDDYAIVFKMESHNHPSQIEPLQGAATGVGGIVRDIFTAGARPIASLNSLRFGDLSEPYNKHLLREVVKGISWYGNCIGVPTIGGEVYFDDSYTGNCLVNAMTIGICKKDQLAQAKASGPGNHIMYVGSTTGRDGIGGCSVLASNEFEEEEAKRPTVQVGDPFMEKCLIEATLETLATGHVVGIKDMGAAGLTCSISEMAAAGGVGMKVDLNQVPLREEGMEAWEIMMSESQERMLVCVKEGQTEEIEKIFKKWNLNAAVIGIVTEEEKVVIEYNNEQVADIDPQALTSPEPKKLEIKYTPRTFVPAWSECPPPNNYSLALYSLLESPNICDRKWIYEQYDHTVQTNMMTFPTECDAAVVRIKGTNKAIAATTDCNSTYVKLDPYEGSILAVLEAARNILCAGAEPAAVTDCLNFANPNKPEMFYYFQKSIEGITKACTELEIPVVSGNVSFYNESPDGPVNPTPTIGMIGIVQDVTHVLPLGFQNPDQIILLISPGIETEANGYCEYLKVVHGREGTFLPYVDIDSHKRLHSAMRYLAKWNFLRSAHDCAEGGLAVALAECCFPNQLGAKIFLKGHTLRPDAELFSEYQSRVLVTCDPYLVDDVITICRSNRIGATLIGSTNDNDELTIDIDNKNYISASVSYMKRIWSTSLEKKL